MIAALLLAAVTTIDLATPAGLERVKGQWRYADARVVETEFRAAGHDSQPTGAPVKTLDIAPHAGGVDFDDAGWQVVPAEALLARRGNGRLSFAWYRINVTVPDDLAGSDVSFSTSVDDYAEIWVDGELARAPGSMITGWNTENKVVIARNAKAGQKIQLAIFGANGPLSNPPTNYIWIHYAKLEFAPSTGAPVAVTPVEVNVEVIRNDPAIDAIVPANPKIFKLAEGFTFTEGPVWEKDYLLFSDPNENRIYRYDGKLTVFREKSGYEGADIAEYRQPGSNGLTFDKDGRLTFDQHGNRRVVRLEKDGTLTVLADKFDGKRLNSPNDLVYRSDGALFFTDPFFGLPKFDKDPRKELSFQGVYALVAGKLKLVTKELSGPNGIAFSPDEKYLYVGNWQDDRKVVMRYAVTAAGDVTESKVFFDMTGAKGEDAIDGIKVDQAGNLFVSGPGGLWILSPEAKHLGTILAPRHLHNMAWGDDDGKSLYLCARDKLYRIRLNIPGIRP